MSRQVTARSIAVLMIAMPLPALAQVHATGFLDRTVKSGSEMHRFQVYVPSDHSNNKQWPVILWLHGNGSQGSDGLRPTEGNLGSAIRRDRERFPAVVVFPQAQEGHLWDDAMKAQAVAALEAATREFHGDPDRTYLIGSSMGGRGAWSLAAKQPERFAAMVVIAGPVADIPDRWTTSQRETAIQENDWLRSDDPFRILASKIKSIPIWLLHGSADPLAPPEESRRMSRELQSANAEVKFTEYEGLGHDATRALAESELWSWLLAKRRPRRSR